MQDERIQSQAENKRAHLRNVQEEKSGAHVRGIFQHGEVVQEKLNKGSGAFQLGTGAAMVEQLSQAPRVIRGSQAQPTKKIRPKQHDPNEFLAYLQTDVAAAVRDLEAQMKVVR